ncbi:MAG TPA: hypothetical protein VFN61_13110 [Acidimicrobiales bacterium]|nr:hypothetical protein [Acidimicrobiales bacterium]
MSKQRFEAPTLDLAVQAAKDALGEQARIVGANRVRRGGVGGFFTKEYIEVEAEEPGSKAKTAQAQAQAQAGNAAGRKAAANVANAAPPGPRGAATGPRPMTGTALPPATLSGFGAAVPEDALSDLIEEMAQSGPSSILDLAERVNSEQSRFALSEDNTPMGDMISAVRASDDFAELLQRIAAEAGLLAGESGETGSNGLDIDVHHSGAILTDLRGPDLPASSPIRPSAPEQRAVPQQAPVAQPLPPVAAVPDLAGVPGVPGVAGAPLTCAPALTGRHNELRRLGLPVVALPAGPPGGSLEQLESDLRAALEDALPPLPALPYQATSVVAVLGERKDLLSAAKALAGELGTPADEIALATRRGVWRQQQDVIGSPEAASERKRGWRWRERPAVVAIETSVRPEGDAWTTSVLRALEPAMCVGVVEATRKPEDVAAWSEALGGLDALAVTDLAATTSPAALLGGPVPVARADGQPATAAFWAHELCARLR